MRRSLSALALSSFLPASLLVLSFAAAPVQGQLATLTEDLGSTRRAGSGAPDDFRLLGDLLLFRAEGEGPAKEPWVTDGTREGTRQLATTCTGSCEDDLVFVADNGERAFFLSGTPAIGDARTLWSTDGTPEGTREVTERYGRISLPPYSPDFPSWLEPDYRFLGDKLYFFADPITGPFRGQPPGLWSSDGTPEGTARTQLGPAEGWNGTLLQVAGDRLFFVAAPNSGSSVTSVWVTDGTAAGTQELLALPEGASFWDSALVGPAGDQRYVFLFDTFQGDLVLGFSDGTPEGSAVFEASAEGEVELLYRWLAPAGDALYFAARTTEEGTELWRTDGTAAGTVRVTRFANPDLFDPFADVTPDQISAVPGSPGAVVLIWEDGRWNVYGTTGDPASTVRVGAVCESPNCNVFRRLVEAGDALAFAAVGPGPSSRLLFIRGHGRGRLDSYTLPCAPEQGRCEIDDLDARDGSRSSPLLSVTGGTDMYFWYPAPIRGTEGAQLWATDGTAAGTRPVSDLEGTVLPPDGSRRPLERDARGRLFFGVGVEAFAGSTPEPGALWVDAGSGAGARRLESFARAVVDFAPGELASLGDRALAAFCSSRSGGRDGGVAVSEGSPETSFVLTELASECGPFGRSRLTAAETFAVVLKEVNRLSYELWRTDGTLGGTFPIGELLSPGEQLDETTVTALGNRVYFLVASLGEDGRRPELWSTDGTSAGTRRDVDLGALGMQEARQLTAAAGRLFLSGTDQAPTNARPSSLWESDGTQAGTRKLAVLPPSSFILSLLEVEARGTDVYFIAGDSFAPAVYLATAGSTEAQLVLPLRTGAPGPLRLVSYGEDIYLIAKEDSDAGGEDTALWRIHTDTREPEALALFDRDELALSPGEGPYLTEHQGLLYFAAAEEEHGTELWRSDGTQAGTWMVSDALPGTRGVNPRHLTSTPEGLFFSGFHPLVGRELWRSDGTAPGTRMVHDIRPGPASSEPGPFETAGGRLYLAADDGYRGRELWSLDLSDPPSTCVPSDRELCLRGTDYRAILGWFDRDGNSAQALTRPLTEDTGAFYYRNPDNLETVVKVLDGRPINDHLWTFLASLSNVEYVLDVTHAESGISRRYRNPQGNFASLGDTFAFGPEGTPLDLEAALAALEAGAAPSQAVDLGETRAIRGAAFSERRIAPRTCALSSERLCLQGGRFAVEVDWRDFRDRTGAGTAVPLTADTGYFWFFDDANVELILKVLDGTDLNGSFWVFYGALSNVEYTITVTDTQEGLERTYFNPLRSFASVGDTGAFPQ